MILPEETSNSKIRFMKKRLWFPELPKLHSNFKNVLKKPINSFMETIIDINKNVYKNDRSFTKYKLI